MKNRNIFASRVGVKIEGLNLKRLLKALLKNNIRLYNLNQKSHKEMFFCMDTKNKKALLPYKKGSGYKITFKNTYGLAGIFNFFKNKLGFLVGLVLGVVFLGVMSSFVWNIEIYGQENILENEIIEVLKQEGVEIGKSINNVDVEEIETALQKNLEEISLVSVIKKGSSVIINIKETLEEPVITEEQFVPLIAQCDCLITNMSVTQGSAVVKEGDLVRKGDILVEPHYINNEGQRIKVFPIAEIYANIWYNEKVEINTKGFITIRSGNYVENSYLLTGKNQSIIKENSVSYNNFETEESEQFLFYNNLLPLKIKKVRIYELIEVENSFSKEAEIEKAKQEALLLAEDKVPPFMSIASTFTSVTELEEKIIVCGYAEVNLKIGVY